MIARGERTVDDRRFDELSRRVGALASPRLRRRGLLGLLGGATLAGAVGAPPAAAARCKDEGQKCDKKKCKKKDKKCCCDDLKCKNGRCEPKGGSCRTDATLALSWPGGDQTDGDFDDPWGITTDPSSNVYVTDSGNQRVQVFDANGDWFDEWGSNGTGDEQFLNPLGIGYNDNSADRVYVSDPQQPTAARKLRRFEPDGDFTNDGDIGRTSLGSPAGIAIDADRNIWVVDASSTGEIFLYDPTGEFETSWTPGGNGALDSPEGIAVFEDGSRTFVFVSDTGNNRVVKFEFTGISDDLDLVAEQDQASSQALNGPTGLAVDSCGNVWVADRFNNRVQLFDKNLNFEGRISGLNRPTGVALSPNGRSLYVVNFGGNDVDKYELS